MTMDRDPKTGRFTKGDGATPSHDHEGVEFSPNEGCAYAHRPVLIIYERKLTRGEVIDFTSRALFAAAAIILAAQAIAGALPHHGG